MAQAYLISFRWDFATLPSLLGRIETLLQAHAALSADRRQSLQAGLDCLYGKSLMVQGDFERAIVQLERALTNLPLAHEYARTEALSFLVGAYANSGRRAAGLALLHTALEEAATQQRPTIIFLLTTLAVIQLCAGELTDVAHTAERILTMLDAPHQRGRWQGVEIGDEGRGWAHYFLGVVHYERNDLATAGQHWRQVEPLRHRTNTLVYHDSLVGLALIGQAQGLARDALAYAQAAREFAAEAHSLAALAISDALAVRLALMDGNTADALRRSQEIQTGADRGGAFWLEVPPLTRVRALLAHAAPASLTAALQLAESCLRDAENAHNIRQVIQISALQALVLHALRRPAEAHSALARALTLAEPGGFVRTFLDLGAPLAELLRLFAAQHGPSTYVKRLLAAFAQEYAPAHHSDLTAQYTKLHGITPLTPRELELLALIGQRLSIGEIATTLVISPNTVKKHANNIYTKLGVRNRREALGKAQALGLL